MQGLRAKEHGQRAGGAGRQGGRRRTHKTGPIIMRRGRVRGRKGVAVELGVNGHRADLVDHTKFANVHVHLGLNRQLPRRLEDGHAGLHGAATPGPNQSARVKHQDAATRVAEGELDCGESFGSKICIRAPRANGVQVERQLDAAAGHRDCLRQRDNVDEAWHKVQNLGVVGEG